MKISHDDSVTKDYWKLYDKDIGDVKLNEQLDGYEERLKEIKDRRHKPSTLTTEDAFPLSLQYCNFLCFCISVAALNNPVFNGMEGPSTFDTIR